MPEAESVWTDIPPIFFAEQVTEHATALLGNVFGRRDTRLTQVCKLYLENDLASMHASAIH